MRYLYIYPIFLMFYEFTLYMSNDMYIPAFPSLVNDFAVSKDLIQYTISSWLFGGSIAQIFLGPMSDRFGRRPVLFLGGILFLFSCLICAITNSISFFIFSRFLQGIGVCSMMIAGYASIQTIYKDKEAINILALMGGVSVIAPMIGPLIGGYLITLYTWRIIFYVIFTLAALALGSLYFIMPLDHKKDRIHFNFKNIWLGYYELINNRLFIGNAVIYGLLYSIIMLWISISPFLLMDEKSLNPKEFGLIQIPVFASFILGSQLLRLLINKISLNVIITGGICGAFISSFVLLIGAIYFPESIFWIIISMVIYSFCFGITSAPLNRTIFNSSLSSKGITVSLFYSCMMGIGTIITMLFGFLFEQTTISYAIYFIIIIFIIIIKYNNVNK